MAFWSLELSGYYVSCDVSEERKYHLARYSLLRKIPDDHRESKIIRENLGDYMNFLYPFDQQLIALHLHLQSTDRIAANLFLARGNLSVQGTYIFVLRSAMSCVNKKLINYK